MIYKYRIVETFSCYISHVTLDHFSVSHLTTDKSGIFSKIWSLSSDVLEWRTSTGSEPVPLLIYLHGTKIALLRNFTLMEMICPNICSNWRFKSAKRPLLLDVRGSKTSLLKLPNMCVWKRICCVASVVKWGAQVVTGRHLASLPVISGVTRFTLHQIINYWVSQKAMKSWYSICYP